MKRKPTYEELERRVRELEAVAENTRKIAAAVEQSIEGIATSDLEGRLMYVNKAYATMHGYSSEEMLGMNAEDFLDSRQTVEPQEILNQIETEGSCISELGHLRKDGTRFPVYESFTLLRNNEGKPTGSLTVCRDVTEHKLVENRMRKLSNAVDQSIDGIAMGDNRTGITYVNKAYAEMHGYSPEEMIGMVVEDLIDPEYSKSAREVVEEIRTHGSYVDEISHIRKDGTTFPTYQSIVATMEDDGKTLGGLSVCRDITKQKQAEEEIRKLNSAVEQSIDGIATADLEGRLTHINRAYATMHGYSPKEMIGMETKLLLDEKQMIHHQEITNQIETQGSFMGEVGHMRKDGTPLPVYESVTMLRDDDGKALGGLAVCRDMTPIKEATKMLEESEERYRILFEDANDAIFIADAETHIILDANKQAERLIGCPRQDIIGMHQRELHPSLQAEYYEDVFDEDVETGRNFDEGAEVVKKDGRIIPVFISSSVVSIRGKRVLQGLFRDIDAEREFLDLREEMRRRKLMTQASRILMDHHDISEKEAMNRLRKESRRQSKKLKYICQAVISSELILD